MENVTDTLIDAVSKLGAVADAVTPDEAQRTLGEATLEVFWRDWPDISEWAGSLWRLVNTDRAGPATPARDPDLDEVGGEGG